MSGAGHTNGPGPPGQQQQQQQQQQQHAAVAAWQQHQQQQQMEAAAAAYYMASQAALASGVFGHAMLNPYSFAPGVNGNAAAAGLMRSQSPPAGSPQPPPLQQTQAAGQKHGLSAAPAANEAEQPMKRQKLGEPPALQTASASGDSAAAAAASPTASGGAAEGGKQRMTEPMLSPTPSSPPSSTADAYSSWVASNGPTGAGSVSAESVEAGCALAKASLAKLAAWRDNAQAEIELLQRMLLPGGQMDAYVDFAQPYAAPFAAVDQATPVPTFTTLGASAAAAASTAGPTSRLARAAHSVAQHSASHEDGSAELMPSLDGVSAGPTLEELEARRAELASKIKIFQADSGRKLDKSLEPPRNKCHWDYLLAEMEWMAGDFVRERKWKTVLAKKISRGVLTHHKREVGKEFRALKDEVMQRRKRAAWVSREIKKFWSNIGKLVKHKHNALVEEEKKKQMGEHLETLVHQTETFSSKLAQDLTVKGVAGAQKALALAEAKAIAEAKAQAAAAAAATGAASSTPSAAAAAAGSTSPSAAAVASASPATAAGASSTPATPAADEESADTDGIEVGRVDDILQSLKGPNTADARRSTRVHKPLASPTGAAGAAAGAGADDANDGDFGEDESSEDDEGTLSEEEEKDAAESGGRKADAVKAEVSALEAEAEMSIEELRKLYGADREEEEEEEEGEDGEGEEEGAEDEEEEEGAGEDAAATSESASAPGSSTSASPATGAGDETMAADDGDAEGDDGGGDDDSDDGAGEDGPDGADEDAGNNTNLLLQQKNAQTEEQRMTIASELAAAAQPQGFTLADVKVKTKVPYLIRGPGPLREYQHIGLDWLVSMYDNGLNGILADEMGLGKTVMTIALLAHLALEKGIWGQHLIVVPTSVIVNWEMEFKRWLPAFKVLSYHGNAKERKLKRRGWSDPFAFHACITSYQLVLQDARIFKRKRWHYLILDEAHNIKNFKSQRWQTLLHFRTHRRLLLTGTPLQNSVSELWSLMHFLMPNIFQSQTEFKEWFSNPVAAMVEGKEAVNQKLLTRLHGILRPFLLRRLKTTVAQQLPAKFEHVLTCKMSKRQRFLYEDFMAASDTQRTLASGNFMGMMNVVMSLRKVCNHPDLFSGRAIVSPFDQFEPLSVRVPSLVVNLVPTQADDAVRIGSLDLASMHLLLQAHQRKQTTQWEAERIATLATPKQLIEQVQRDQGDDPFENAQYPIDPVALPYVNQLRAQRLHWRASRRTHVATLNALRTQKHDFALWGADKLRLLRLDPLPRDIHALEASPARLTDLSTTLSHMVRTYADRAEQMQSDIEHVCCIIPKARAKPPRLVVARPDRASEAESEVRTLSLLRGLSPASDIFRTSFARQQIFFPDKYLLQWDCGKLQRLAVLLRERMAGGHRVLIFSQFSKMLDILESFLSMHGYKYLRLDGSTKVDDRQRLMERFNRDTKYFVFILSTRSGGIGINLTGADTCVMYDSDWNPAMDLQAQDRAHRLGQTKEVNIFRLITERSIEENILKKSNQKRDMNNAVIGDGNFNTDYLDKLDPRELLGLGKLEPTAATSKATIEDITGEDDEERKQGEAPAAAVKTEPSSRAVKSEGVKSEESLSAQIERQRADMAMLEDEADRIALQQSLAETQADIDDFAPADVGEASKARAAAAHPASSVARTGGAPAIRSMGKVGVLRGKPSTAASAAVAAFENALTPVQRYALHFAEYVDPVITAQQMKATQRQMQLDEQKWREKQSKAGLPVGSPTSAAASGAAPNPSPSPSAGDAMDTSDGPTIKVEPADPSQTGAGGVTVKKEPLDPAPSGSGGGGGGGGGGSLPASPSGRPSSSPSPSSTSPSKNVQAGNRLEDKYLIEQFQLVHPHYFSRVHALAHTPDFRVAYEYPFSQPEYAYSHQQQQQFQQQMQQHQLNVSSGSTKSTPPVPLPAATQFGVLPPHALITHPYFNAQARRAWQAKQYKVALRSLQQDRAFAGVRAVPLKDCPLSPTSSDYASSSSDSDDDYGLFSDPDSISRMLGPRLHHPDRTRMGKHGRHGLAGMGVGVGGVGGGAGVDAKSAAPPAARRRVVGVEGEIRVAFVSADNSDPVSVRIPWLKLKSGGMDRSSLVLSRAGVDYPAKINRSNQQQGALHNQQAAQRMENMVKQRWAYHGLNIEQAGAQPFQHGGQQRPLAPSTITMPTQKRTISSPGTKPLPAAAAAGGSPQREPLALDGVVGVRRKREGLFSTKLGQSRPRPPALDENVLKESKNWSVEEDHVLQASVTEHGTNWLLIAQVLAATPRLAGRLRSVKEVQNRYAYLLYKKAGGVDPVFPPKSASVAGAPSTPGSAAGGPGSVPGTPNDSIKPPDMMDTSGGGGGDDSKKKKHSKKDKNKDKEASSSSHALKKKSSSSAQPAGGSAAGGAAQQPSAGGVGFGSKNVLMFVERATKAMKGDQQAVRASLRQSFGLPTVEDPTSKTPFTLPLHKSHKDTVIEAHTRLGLPPAAMGKTLMPHQIIQLRMRRQQQRAAQMLDEKGRPLQQLTPEQYRQQMQQQQQQQQQGGHMVPGGGGGGMPPQQGRPNYPPNVPGGGGGGGMNMGPGGVGVSAPPPNQRMSSTPTGSNMGRSGAPPPGPHMQGPGGPQQYPQQQQRMSSQGSQQPGQQSYPQQSGANYSQQGGMSQGPQQGGYNSGGGNYAPNSQHYPQGSQQGSQQYSNPSQLQRYQTAPSSSNTPRSGSGQQQQAGQSGYAPSSTSSGQRMSSNAPMGGGGGNYASGGNTGYSSSGAGGYSQSQGGSSSGYYPSSSTGGGGGGSGYNASNPSPPPGSTSLHAPSNSSRAKSPAGNTGASYNYQQAGGGTTPNMPAGSSQAYYPPQQSGATGGTGYANYSSSGGGTAHYPARGGSSNYSQSAAAGGSSGGYNNYSSSGGGGGSSSGSSAADLEAEGQLKQILQYVSHSLPAIQAPVFEVAHRKAISTQQKLAEITVIIKTHQEKNPSSSR